MVTFITFTESLAYVIKKVIAFISQGYDFLLNMYLSTYTYFSIVEILMLSFYVGVI